MTNVPLKDVTMERVRVEEFEGTLMYRLWMNQSGFSLGFLSQNSLWKLSTIRGYKGYLYWCVFGMRKVMFQPNRAFWRLNVLVVSLSCELTA